jgi:hypothetical protein
MFKLSALFGRSREVRRLDDALRAAGLDPDLLPDAVKIAALNLLKEAGLGVSPAPAACGMATEMLAYCLLGDQGFQEANGPGSTRKLERRMQAALDAGDSLDARLVLLTIHAGVIEHGLLTRYDLHAGDTP